MTATVGPTSTYTVLPTHGNNRIHSEMARNAPRGQGWHAWRAWKPDSQFPHTPTSPPAAAIHSRAVAASWPVGQWPVDQFAGVEPTSKLTKKDSQGTDPCREQGRARVCHDRDNKVPPPPPPPGKPMSPTPQRPAPPPPTPPPFSPRHHTRSVCCTCCVPLGQAAGSLVARSSLAADSEDEYDGPAARRSPLAPLSPVPLPHCGLGRLRHALSCAVSCPAQSLHGVCPPHPGSPKSLHRGCISMGLCWSVHAPRALSSQGDGDEREPRWSRRPGVGGGWPRREVAERRTICSKAWRVCRLLQPFLDCVLYCTPVTECGRMASVGTEWNET